MNKKGKGRELFLFQTTNLMSISHVIVLLMEHPFYRKVQLMTPSYVSLTTWMQGMWCVGAIALLLKHPIYRKIQIMIPSYVPLTTNHMCFYLHLMASRGKDTLKQCQMKKKKRKMERALPISNKRFNVHIS